MIKRILIVLMTILIIGSSCSCGNSNTDETIEVKPQRTADSYNELEFGGALFSIPDHFGEGTMSEDGLSITYIVSDDGQNAHLALGNFDIDLTGYTDDDLAGVYDTFVESIREEFDANLSNDYEIEKTDNGFGLVRERCDYEMDGQKIQVYAGMLTDLSNNIVVTAVLAQNEDSEYDYEDELYSILNNASCISSSDNEGEGEFALINDDGSKKRPDEVFTYFLQQKFDEVADLEKIELRFSKQANEVASYDIYVDGNHSEIYLSYDNANTMCTIGGKLSNEEKFMRVYGLSCACLISDETGIKVLDAYDEFDSMLGELSVGSQVDRTIGNIRFSFKEIEVDGEHFVLFTDYRS